MNYSETSINPIETEGGFVGNSPHYSVVPTVQGLMKMLSDLGLALGHQLLYKYKRVGSESAEDKIVKSLVLGVFNCIWSATNG